MGGPPLIGVSAPPVGWRWSPWEVEHRERARSLDGVNERVADAGDRGLAPLPSTALP
jgi:hypothetical protein